MGQCCCGSDAAAAKSATKSAKYAPPKHVAKRCPAAFKPLTEEAAAALTQSAFLRRTLMRDDLDSAALNARIYELRYACNGGCPRGFTRDTSPPGAPGAGARAAFMPLCAVQSGIVGDDAERRRVAEFHGDDAAATFERASRAQGMGTNYGPRDFTLLHYACVDDEPGLVRLLLDRGADLRVSAGVLGKRCGRGGVYPLTVAAANECHKVVEVLFAHVKRKRRREKLMPLILLVEQCARAHPKKRGRGNLRRHRARALPRLPGACGGGDPAAEVAILWLASLDKYLRRGIMRGVCSYLV